MTRYTRQTLHCIRDNALPMIPLALYTGPNGRLLLAGAERWTRYFVQRFHGPQWVRQPLGQFPAWAIPHRLRRHAQGADLTIARLDRLSAQHVAGLVPGVWRVPEWVRMVAPVPPSNEAFTSRSAKEDLRAIRRHNLTWRVTRDISELRRHISRDYYPYTRLRHGHDAFVQTGSAIRRAFARGGLLVVEQASRPVAGLVFAEDGATMQMLTIACSDADASLLSLRAMAAVYAFSFDYARSAGLDFIDFRGARPTPADSLFFVKRKWGGRVKKHGELLFDLLFHWSTLNASVQRFLRNTPLIFEEHSGLSVVGLASSETSIAWRAASLHRFVCADAEPIPQHAAPAV